MVVCQQLITTVKIIIIINLVSNPTSEREHSVLIFLKSKLIHSRALVLVYKVYYCTKL